MLPYSSFVTQPFRAQVTPSNCRTPQVAFNYLCMLAVGLSSDCKIFE